MKSKLFILTFIFFVFSCAQVETSKITIPINFNFNSQARSPENTETFVNYTSFIAKASVEAISEGEVHYKSTVNVQAGSDTKFEFRLPTNITYDIKVSILDNDDNILYYGSKDLLVEPSKKNIVEINLVKNRSKITVDFTKIPSPKNNYTGKDLDFLKNLKCLADNDFNYEFELLFNGEEEVGYSTGDTAYTDQVSFIVDGFATYNYYCNLLNKGEVGYNIFWIEEPVDVSVKPGDDIVIYPPFEYETKKLYIPAADLVDPTESIEHVDGIHDRDEYDYSENVQFFYQEWTKIKNVRLSLYFIETDNPYGQASSEDLKVEDMGLLLDSKTFSIEGQFEEVAMHIEKFQILESQKTDVYYHIVLKFEALDKNNKVVFWNKPYSLIEQDPRGEYDSFLENFDIDEVNLFHGLDSVEAIMYWTYEG